MKNVLIFLILFLFPLGSLAQQVTDDFAGDGALSGYTTFLGNTDDGGGTDSDNITPIGRVDGRYRAVLADNSGNDTLHYNADRGRLDAKLVSFPFTYIARNIGIGTVADSQAEVPYSGNQVNFCGIQVKHQSSDDSAHIVVGHRGTGRRSTIESKNTISGTSTVDDNGQDSIAGTRADLKVVGTSDGDLIAFWQEPNLTGRIDHDDWQLYNGTGDFFGTDTDFGSSVYIGLITYAQGSLGVPFVGTCDGVELVGETAYDPPIGVPDPSVYWETFGNIHQEAPGWPASWLTATTTATPDHYFVDKTHPSATNSGNPYGHPQLPRTTFPEGLIAAGAYIYLHAGTYDNLDSGGDRFDMHGAGTAANPIWVVGNKGVRPILTDRLHIGLGGAVSYMIIDGLQLGDGSTGGGGIRVYPQNDGDTISRVMVRNCLFWGNGVLGAGGGLSFGISQNTNTIPTSVVQYCVAYNNVIHNIEDRTTSDAAGFYCGYPVDHLWVLDSHIYDVASDSIAGSHYSDRGDKDSYRYFIGRNWCHDNGENGIDIKSINYGVISENIVTGPFTREQGWGIILHSGHSVPSAYPTENFWVVANHVYGVSGGIYISGTEGADSISIVGNLIEDIDADYAAASDSINGRAIQYRSEYSGNAYIANNTIVGYDTGIFLDDFGSGQTATVYGNILRNRYVSGNYDVDWDAADGGTISLDYNNISHPSYSVNLDGVTQGANGTTTDPLFVNEGGGDYRLGASSPAIDASIEGAAYDAFETLFAAFSTSVQYDFDGRSRPIGSAIDRGAFEFVGGGTIPDAPSSPSATANSSSQITVEWTDNSDNETGFKIYRGTSSGSLSLIGTATANETSFVDTELSASTTYYYEIASYNGAGDSDPTSEVSATTEAASGGSPGSMTATGTATVGTLTQE